MIRQEGNIRLLKEIAILDAYSRKGKRFIRFGA
jgi:hypothetical protein